MPFDVHVSLENQGRGEISVLCTEFKRQLGNERCEVPLQCFRL